MDRIEAMAKIYDDCKNALDRYRRSVEFMNKRINPEFADEELLERLKEGTPMSTIERVLGTTHDEYLTLPWED